MAEARHGIRITEPLKQVMRKVFDSGHGLSERALATLADAVSAIDNVVSHINESTAFFSEQPSLLARFHDIETELDAAIAREAIDASGSALVPALAAVPEEAAAPPPAEEFDHEIANIYSEEATELLERPESPLPAGIRTPRARQAVRDFSGNC